MVRSQLDPARRCPHRDTVLSVRRQNVSLPTPVEAGEWRGPAGYCSPAMRRPRLPDTERSGSGRSATGPLLPLRRLDVGRPPVHRDRAPPLRRSGPPPCSETAERRLRWRTGADGDTRGGACGGPGPTGRRCGGAGHAAGGGPEPTRIHAAKTVGLTCCGQNPPDVSELSRLASPTLLT